ncbi:MAG: hypothetical protein IPG96_11540 [Proteobacteria bacterium]|nr:hypothetical protein [Pseudomonadota bacterium]
MSRSTLRMPAPRSRQRAVRVLRALWTLPTDLVGHSVGLLVSGGRGVRRIGGPAAVATIYPCRIPCPWQFGAVTLGQAIIYRPPLAEGIGGRLLLAHELAHSRQHDVLGPLYLPAHLLVQLISALVFVGRRSRSGDPIHAHNPLEQRWLCLGFDAYQQLLRGEGLGATARERLLQRFGV